MQLGAAPALFSIVLLAGVSVNEHEDMLLVSLEPTAETEEEDPVKKEAKEHAEQQRGHVSIVNSELELKNKFEARIVAGNQVVGFLVDCQTSRVSVSNGYIDSVGKLISALNLKKVNVAVVCGQRMDMVSTVSARLAIIKGMQTFVVQLTGRSQVATMSGGFHACMSLGLDFISIAPAIAMCCHSIKPCHQSNQQTNLGTAIEDVNCDLWQVGIPSQRQRGLASLSLAFLVRHH